MARLRTGRGNTGRGAANFLWETVSRVRYVGANGELSMRADSDFCNHVLTFQASSDRFHRTRSLNSGLDRRLSPDPEILRMLGELFNDSPHEYPVFGINLAVPIE